MAMVEVGVLSQRVGGLHRWMQVIGHTAVVSKLEPLAWMQISGPKRLRTTASSKAPSPGSSTVTLANRPGSTSILDIQPRDRVLAVIATQDRSLRRELQTSIRRQVTRFA